MAEQWNRKLDDQLIKEALKLEIEAAEAPPTARAWHRLEKHLEKPRPASRFARFGWHKMAAVAALFLVLVLGSISFIRSLHFGAQPVADSLIAEDAPEEMAALQVEEEPLTVSEPAAPLEETRPEQETATEELPAPDPVERAESEPDHAADDGQVGIAAFGVEENAMENGPAGEAADEELWPSSINGQFRLYNTVILSAEGEPQYQAGIYRSNAAEVMLVRADRLTDNPVEFVEDVGTLIGVEPQIFESRGDVLYFEVYAMPGLAWLEDRRSQALFVVSGSLEPEELEVLANLIMQ